MKSRLAMVIKPKGWVNILQPLRRTHSKNGKETERNSWCLVPSYLKNLYIFV